MECKQSMVIFCYQVLTHMPLADALDVLLFTHLSKPQQFSLSLTLRVGQGIARLRAF